MVALPTINPSNPLDVDDGTYLAFTNSTTNEVKSTALRRAVQGTGRGVGGASGLFFKDDGTQLFVTFGGSLDITGRSMGIAWDVTTQNLVANPRNVDGASTKPRGQFWKPDGLKAWFVDAVSDRIVSYPTATAWNTGFLSTIGSQVFTPTQATNPTGVWFKSDGTKMYVSDLATGDVFQYSLSTAWDITTATYDTVSLDTTGQVGELWGLAFSDDGTKLYAVDGGSGATIYQYTLSSAWDLSTAAYASKSVYVGASEARPRACMAKTTVGTHFYVIGAESDTVLDYTLGTAYDLSTASLNASGVARPYNATPYRFLNRGGALSSDGLHLYAVSDQNDHIVQFDLLTANDISSAVFAEKRLSISGQTTSPKQMELSEDGTKLYLLGGTTIYQYNLSVAYDISAATFSTSLSVVTNTASPNGFAFSSDGTKLLVCDYGAGVDSYTLGTAWAINTGTYSTTFSTTTQTTSPYSVKFTTSGLTMFVLSQTDGTIYQYTLTVAWDISTASSSGLSYVTNFGGSTVADLALGSDDATLVVFGTSNNETMTPFVLWDLPSDWSAMATLLWQIVAGRSTAGDDTFGIDIRIMSGATVLAAADAAGTFSVITNAVPTATTADSTFGSPTAFAYVNTGGTRAQWLAATVELRQRYTINMSADGAHVQVDLVTLTGTYTAPALPSSPPMPRRRRADMRHLLRR